MTASKMINHKKINRRAKLKSFIVYTYKAVAKKPTELGTESKHRRFLSIRIIREATIATN